MGPDEGAGKFLKMKIFNFGVKNELGKICKLRTLKSMDDTLDKKRKDKDAEIGLGLGVKLIGPQRNPVFLYAPHLQKYL